MKTKAAPRCALYLRVSTGPQVEGNSLVTQKVLLIEYARSRGYSVVDVYTDAGFSGKNTDRPELKRLLADVKRRRIDIVLVWKVDRISRSMRDLLGLIATLRDHGVEFAAVDQQFDTSDPMGLLVLHVLGSFAQFEREILIERTKEGHLRRLQEGDWSCGPVPFGYRKENGKLIEVPEEAETVRLMFRLFLKVQNRGEVARELNRRGIQTRKGKRWDKNTVTYILRNPVYTGANVYGRHAKGDTRLKRRAKWIVVPGSRMAMVPEATFEAAREVMRASKDVIERQRERQCRRPRLQSRAGNG